jgi:pseudouridine synthase
MAAERLQKILARLGVASRRQAEILIQSGRVCLNGDVVTELGCKADLDLDRIEVDGVLMAGCQPPSSPLHLPPLHTLLLNKPIGYLSTCSDPYGRKTVLDLLPPQLRRSTRLYPIGRLDANSSGALLLSNDGDLALQLTHPRHHVAKTYQVEVAGSPTDETLQHWRDGVDLEDGITLPAQVYRCSPVFRRSNTTRLTVVLWEGRKRQIRRVAEKLGHPVVALHREAIGSLRLGDLALGQFRPLSESELSTLKCESQSGYVV